ncbi:MAG: alpha-1,2-fucosyltransferase [Bacteroidota bacterium]|nr:alpha-1,2-fucosyltransferase [Bacteroidota bacterium]
MIITKITSGLGNQLFQYAAAKSLSLKHNTSLFFDLSYYDTTYETDTPRSFKLHHFNIDYKNLDTSPLVYFSKATKLFRNRSCKPFFSRVKEKHFHYDDQVVHATGACITLEGFWQSEKYFAQHTEAIRNELTFKSVANSELAIYKQQMLNTQNPISIHIRRGDYVSHPEFSKSFGFVGLEYYDRAVAYVKSKVQNPAFFVFTDDKDWVKSCFHLTDKNVFVETNGEDSDVTELQLMSLCTHHIIANSSFSWWGAWLNNSKSKIVIAPASWYKNKTDWNTKDLIPPSWVTV